MTDIKDTQNQPASLAQAPRARSRWRGAIIGGAAALALAGGIGVAVSQPGSWGGHGGGHGGGYGGGHHGARGGEHGHGPMWRGGDPAQRIERGVERMLGRVDATDEQKRKVTEILKGAAKEMQAMRSGARGMRGEVASLLKAEKIDRAAMEKLRADRIASADAASKRMTQAIADAAEVLTPKQRAELAERMESFGFGRGGGRRGG
jgi:Spy/CpxP family protein refolding chaperone